MAYRSRRIPSDLSLTRLAAARAATGEVPFDLTVSNPTVCGLPYPQDLLACLASEKALRYDPDPRGPRPARAAVAATYAQWGANVDPARVILTASTSEAYGLLFRLLADPGDAILVPAPSYPLFDQLARLDALRIVAYALDPEDGWRIDFAALETASDNVRAAVVVHPNNPTGSFVHPEDAVRLSGICRERGWALIADEVFLPYAVDGGPGDNATFASETDCLCCTLGGLSKMIGLPQLKVGWIVVSGPDEIAGNVLEGLDYATDAYLSVGTPAALALPELLVRGAPVRGAISTRCTANLASLRRQAAGYPAISVLPVGGGWSVVVRVPAVRPEEDLAIDLLTDHAIAIHPGYLFGFPSAAYLVLSLLPPEPIFSEGAGRLLEAVG